MTQVDPHIIANKIYITFRSEPASSAPGLMETGQLLTGERHILERSKRKARQSTMLIKGFSWDNLVYLYSFDTCNGSICGVLSRRSAGSRQEVLRVRGEAENSFPSSV